MTDSNNPSAIRSQREIMDALLSLMRQHPYNEITVKQIILEARLARKTFYRNFESKDDVLISMINNIIKDYFDIVNNAECDVLTAIFTFADRYRELLLLLDRNNLMHIPLQCVNEYLPLLRERFLSENNPSVTLFDGLDQSYLIALNNGAIWNVISLWVHRGMTDSPDYVKKTLARYLQRFGQYKEHKRP